MEQNNQNESKKHNLVLNNCKTLSLDGVLEVLNFDDMQISLITSQGELSIEGEGIRIVKYLMQSGEMCVEGRITALIYSCVKKEQKSSFLSRLTR